MEPAQKPPFVAQSLVAFYKWFHGRLHLRGAGALLRAAARFIPGLQAYPYPLPGVGTITLDFREGSSCGMVNVSMGELEPNVFLFSLMERCLTPGAVVWDVGANVGWVCVHFLQPQLRVASIQAFEPNPSALEPLLSLFGRHPLVKVHAFGLGDRNETAQMNVLAGASQLASLKQTFAGHESIPIPIRRGDDAQSELNLPWPDVIKIDVEGFEPEVVAGLPNTIARKQPIIFFEYQFLTDEEIRGMIPAGYDILLMMDDGTLTADFTRRVLGHDAVLFPADRRSLFAGVPVA